jgi:Spy/CpxP family protein refolding chaperone
MFKSGGCKQDGGAFGFGPPWARSMHKGHGEHGGPLALLSEIDLTDEQLEKLAELKVEGIGKFAQGKSYMIGVFQQLSKELSKEQIDKAKIKEIAKQMQAKKSEFFDSMVDRILTFAEVLTYEQRKKIRLAAIKKFLHIEPKFSSEVE